MREHMLKTEKDSIQISSFEQIFDEDMRLLKARSIDTLLHCHPTFFRTMVQFDDWTTAMKFLQENREAALGFWSRYEDDR